MSFPIFIFLTTYIVYLVIFGIFSFITLYHLVRFGFKGLMAFFMTFIFVAGSIFIIFSSFIAFSGIDWGISVPLLDQEENTQFFR